MKSLTASEADARVSDPCAGSATPGTFCADGMIYVGEASAG